MANKSEEKCAPEVKIIKDQEIRKLLSQNIRPKKALAVGNYPKFFHIKI